MEIAYGKGNILMNDEHYEAIRKKISTSIPQIRRDFTAAFSNGESYLKAAGRRYDQPTHYARKIACKRTSKYIADRIATFHRTPRRS